MEVNEGKLQTDNPGRDSRGLGCLNTQVFAAVLIFSKAIVWEQVGIRSA